MGNHPGKELQDAPVATLVDVGLAVHDFVRGLPALRQGYP